MTQGRLRLLLTLLFFVSGLTSLVLQTVWTRMMVLVFGSTTFAVSTVLTAFMGGLALGSILVARMASRLPRAGGAVATYGMLEIAIGLYALLLPVLIGWLPIWHATIWGEAGGSSYHVFGLMRFALAAAILLWPTVAMGATLPVLARVACDRESAASTGKQVGTLYAVNTAGAVFGVLLAGFVLLPRIGMRATNLVACVADLLLGAVALLLWWRAGGVARAPSAPVAAPRRPPALVQHRRWLPRVALLSIGVSGAIAMSYEVAWTRAITLVIGSSTYAFSLILVCFLVGLSSGAALYARRQTTDPDQAQNLALVHLLAALTSAAGVWVIDDLPAVMLVAIKVITLSTTAAFAIKFLIAGAVIVLPAIFMGMAFPAVVQIYAAVGHGPVKTTGHVYAVNTIGAIVGAFAGGFVLIPLVGLQRTLIVLVLCGLVLSAGLASFARGRRRIAIAGSALAIGVLVLVGVRPWDLHALSSGVFRVSHYANVVRSLGKRPQREAQRSARSAAHRAWVAAARAVVPPGRVVDTFEESLVGSRLVYHREGLTTTVGIARTVEASLSAATCWVRHALLVNGKADASLGVLHRRPSTGCGALLDRLPPGSALAVSPRGDAETQLLSGILPFLLQGGDRGERPPRRAMVIGWGSGITVGAALSAPLERLLAVELERAVVEAARQFEPHNGRPQRDPRVTLVSADGRNVLATSAATFDVIISEPSNPWMAGCGNLFTVEFFRSARAHLAQGGVLLQWLQAYEIAPENVWSILASLTEVFESVSVFSPVQAPADLLLVARRSRARFDAQRIAQRLRVPAVRRAVAPLGVESWADVAVRLAADTGGIRQVTSGAPLNTDDNARIEFSTPKDMINYRRYSSRRILSELRGTLRDPRPAFRGLPSGAAEALCWAWLRAGRAAWVARHVEARGPRAACVAVARRLSAPVKPPHRAAVRRWLAGDPRGAEIAALIGSSTTRAVEGLSRLLDPQRDAYVGFALLAHLAAVAGENFDALLFVSAATQIGAQREGAYAPLQDLLARQHYASAQFSLAVQQARQIAENGYPQEKSTD